MDQFKAETKKPDHASDPNQLNLLRMVESRIIEIIQIEDEIKKKYPRLFQQRLPRFMRRRAASHNPHRLPKWWRRSKLTSKNRSKLFLYRRRIRFRKHKRILKKHSQHKYKDPNKTILHKWFAKRFKMLGNVKKNSRELQSEQSGFEFIPYHNNTKNFRNLYKQTRHGCAYFSMAHLVAYQVISPYNTKTINSLNKLTRSVSGFTFSARVLESSSFEVVIHLFQKSDSTIQNDNRVATISSNVAYKHLCPAIVGNHQTHWTLWVARAKADQVGDLLESTGLAYLKIEPRDAIRIRLVGPEAWNEAMRISVDPKKHEEAIKDVEVRLMESRKFFTTIGRCLEEKSATFTYYQTKPCSVDIVFRQKAGRMLWHKLIRHKAHLVGGMRDVDHLLEGKYSDSFLLKPDCN